MLWKHTSDGGMRIPLAYPQLSLKGETRRNRNLSLKLSLSSLHNKVLNPLCVPMFILCPFRSTFDHYWRPPCRTFCFTNNTGSIRMWAPGKATSSIQTLHGAGVEVCLLTYAEACATSSSLLLHPNAGTCYHHVFSLLFAKDCLWHSGNNSYQKKELVISLPYQTHHLPLFFFNVVVFVLFQNTNAVWSVIALSREKWPKPHADGKLQ